MEFGNRAIPWGRTIHEPTMVAGALVLVGFQVTTAKERYLYGFRESSVLPIKVKELSGKITAALVPVEMAVLRAISSAPITWLRACFRPPLPVSPLRAGTATAARRPIMPTTARSSTRVKADCSRQGRKGRKGGRGLRDEGVKGETRRFLILNFGLAEEIGSRETSTKIWPTAEGIKEVTIKVYIPLIYFVNTSLQSKY